MEPRSRDALRSAWRPARRACAIAVALLGFVPAALLSVAPAALAQESGSFALPAGDAVVARLVEHIDPIVSDEPGPSVTLFANGRVRVQYPSYMKRAGVHEMQLTPRRLRRTVRALLARGVAEFDGPRAEGRKRDVARARGRAAATTGVLHDRSDSTTTEIELNLDGYRPAGDSTARAATLRKRVRWRGLRGDAKHYPELPEVAALAAAARELRGLMRDPALVRVDEASR